MFRLRSDSAAGTDFVPSRDGRERLVGLLTRENLSEYLMLRRFGMAPEASA